MVKWPDPYALGCLGQPISAPLSAATCSALTVATWPIACGSTLFHYMVTSSMAGWRLLFLLLALDSSSSFPCPAFRAIAKSIHMHVLLPSHHLLKCPWQVRATETASRQNIKKSYKPRNKPKPEEELKDKNQLLEAVNKQLHQKLTETQGELKDLTQKVELLEKFQDNCLAILESRGLKPGNETLASQQEPATDHTDSMLLLETLKDELKVFNETAKKQMEELQALKVKLKLKEEERAQFLEQQALCKDQASDFTIVLEEMEQLLEM
ncbi:hypothetical protein STEG23_036610 [Scotinomys teguina]